MRVEGSRIVLGGPEDLVLAYRANGYARLDGGAHQIPTPEGYPHELDAQTSEDIARAAIGYMGAVLEARSQVPVEYEAAPTDMSYQPSFDGELKERGQIIVKTAEQARLVVDLSRTVVDENISGFFAPLVHGDFPQSVDEALTDALAGELVMIARGTSLYNWDYEKSEQFRLDGQPLTQEVVIKLLQEDLLGLGQRFGYPNDTERREWLFDKYMRSMQAVAIDTFAMAQRAEGWA